VYDPSLVFFGSGGMFGGPVITFGAGFPIRVWLNSDFDWRHRHIYYHGWSEGRGWIARSRPYVHINNVYVNYNLKNVAANRGVTARAVNYSNLTRYNSVHQNVNYARTRVNTGFTGGAPANSVNNKIIQRNGNVNDSRIDSYRGRETSQPATQPEPSRAEPSQRAAEPPRAPERTENPAFGGNRGNIDARASSQRGQSSRAQASHPAPAPRSSGGGGSHGGGGGGGSHGGGGGRH
jgi:uncharacterized membrane protein YgcG